jgi:ferredoxin
MGHTSKYSSSPVSLFFWTFVTHDMTDAVNETEYNLEGVVLHPRIEYALDALLLRGSFYAGPERTFFKNVTLAASHSGTSAAHSSSVNMNAPIQPSGESISRDNLVLQVAAMLEFSCSYPHACLFQLLESQTISQFRLQLQQATEAVSKAEVDLFCCCYRRSQYLCRCFFAPPCPILLL